MYNSLQHFNEFGTRKIEETIKNFINEKKDLADLVLGLQESLFELGRNILTEVLEDVDEIVGINPHDRVSADVVINSPFQ